MVVALSASGCKSHPNSGGGGNPVYGIAHVVFIIDGATLGSRDIAAVEAGCDLLRYRGIRKQVATDLFDGELVERHVLVERVDDPVSVGPNLPIIIEV